MIETSDPFILGRRGCFAGVRWPAPLRLHQKPGHLRPAGGSRRRVAGHDPAGLLAPAGWERCPSTLVAGGLVEVPALITAVPGEGRITFEGTDGTRTLTSADVCYCVAENSGTEDSTLPQPGTPAWQALLDRLKAAVESGAFRGEKGETRTAGRARCRRTHRPQRRARPARPAGRTWPPRPKG